MKQHEYQVTVKHIADAKGNPSTYPESLQFKAFNHDDIFLIVEKLQQSQLVDDESAKAFAVGLKLFGEVLLENRENPLFKDFLPQFIGFIKALKQNSRQDS